MSEPNIPTHENTQQNQDVKPEPIRQEIDTIKNEMELERAKRDKEAVMRGYADYDDAIKALEADKAKLAVERSDYEALKVAFDKKVADFEIEQADRVKRANDIILEANKKIAECKEREKESDRIRNESIKAKAEAQIILDSQTATEKKEMDLTAKLTYHNDEIRDMFSELGEELIKFGKKYDVLKMRQYGDLLCIDSDGWKFKKQSDIQELVKEWDVRLTRQMGDMQDKKGDYSKIGITYIFKYIGDCTSWLKDKCSINDNHNESEGGIK